ncbi:MAG: primase-helicase family protein [Ginsengibacter sp.]
MPAKQTPPLKNSPDSDSKETNDSTSYFQRRMDALGITDAVNKIELWENENINNEHKDVLKPRPVFKKLPEGIEIVVYTLDRLTINVTKSNGRWKKPFSIKRLEKPIVKADGSTIKYVLPKGAGTYPFFPPSLVKKFEDKTPIDTLYLTEGYFKAFKATMAGIDMIGLSSITHMKDRDTGKLHGDIIRIMEACKVKRMVWLTDGDALDITKKELDESSDLSKRPKNFFHTVTTFKDLLSDHKDLEKWFFHIDTDSILTNNPGKLREDVKGIDDLLCTLHEKEKDIVIDIYSMNAGQYFQKFNITYSTGKVYAHFHLRDVKDFYLFHVDRRPEMKNKEFVFNGTRYSYNEGTGECDVKIPGDAKKYFRVGDLYYKFFQKPNQKGEKELTFESRQKSTIKDDHGPNFHKHIPKYEAFCNIPENFHFQQVVDNCFNVYSPLDYQPEDEECSADDCPTIISFLTHIFGEQKVSYMEGEEAKEFKTIDLALDYLQILYRNPTQKLPILCLVSKENNTGKSTFAHFLRIMFGANVAIVGNADLQNDFNAHWATKSVVICDETKIDKEHVVEKIKSLSTATKIFMNAKGRGQVELDCFIKFVLITNNESTFIKITEEDIRYWVIKVPVLGKENPDILQSIKKEIPAFLSFLNNRDLCTEKRNRMWFHPHLLRTEALSKIVAFSKPTLEKELRIFFRDIFEKMPGEEMINMSLKNIIEVAEIKTNKYDKDYVERILKDNLKLTIATKFYFEIKKKKWSEGFDDFNQACKEASKVFDTLSESQLAQRIKERNISTRYKYPTNILSVEGEMVMENGIGKAYIIYRKDFINPEDELEFESDLSEQNQKKAIASDVPFF